MLEMRVLSGVQEPGWQGLRGQRGPRGRAKSPGHQAWPSSTQHPGLKCSGDGLTEDQPTWFLVGWLRAWCPGGKRGAQPALRTLQGPLLQPRRRTLHLGASAEPALGRLTFITAGNRVDTEFLGN